MIVIGLLGAIALIVIAAINPIEQANRARDTRFRSDGAQLISAIDRYFAARSEFPWETTGAYVTDDDFGFITASAEDVGVCGADCNTDGSLLTTSELKSEFRNRDFIQDSASAQDQIMIGKEAGASSSVYACYIPLAKSSREKSCNDGNVFTISSGDGSRTAVPAGDPSCASTSSSWLSSPLYVCIPE